MSVRKDGTNVGARRPALIVLGAALAAGLAGLQMLLEDDATPERSAAGQSAPTPAEQVKAPTTAVARAESEATLPFDYYVLALSWSPSYCLERPDADQCGKGKRFLLHGLWPNLEDGWRSDCDTRYRRPSQALLARYAPISAGSGLLDYQWRKHGTCTGLSPEEYFETAARAFKAVNQPETLNKFKSDLDIGPEVIEQAFLEANPQFGKDGVTVKCAAGRLSEIRLCLTPDLEPRDCGSRTVRDCRARSIDLPAPK